jgi:hypothetical protein
MFMKGCSVKATFCVVFLALLLFLSCFAFHTVALESSEVHDVANINLALSDTRMVDNYVWATDAISVDGLDNYGLPGRTAVPVNAAAYNGYGRPCWTGNFSLNHSIDSVNQINVTYLAFTPDNYMVTLTEGVDYLVHTPAKIELLKSVDVPIIDEHWVDGVNHSLLGWARINHVASGIESVYVKFPNGTERLARNYGYAVPPPSEWFYSPDWAWELTLWQLLDYCIDGPHDWPAGSEWWINYTAASYLTVDYTMIAHDLAIVDVSASKTIVGQEYNALVNITVENQGDYAETFNVTAYANTTVIGTLTNVTLMTLGSSTTLSFLWNTAEFAMGHYAMSAYVTPVPDEIESYDNTFTDGAVTVSIPGDLDADFDVDIYDVVILCTSYLIPEGHGDPNCDINSNGHVDIYDVVILCSHYGETYT